MTEMISQKIVNDTSSRRVNIEHKYLDEIKELGAQAYTDRYLRLPKVAQLEPSLKLELQCLIRAELQNYRAKSTLHFDHQHKFQTARTMKEKFSSICSGSALSNPRVEHFIGSPKTHQLYCDAMSNFAFQRQKQLKLKPFIREETIRLLQSGENIKIQKNYETLKVKSKTKFQREQLLKDQLRTQLTRDGQMQQIAFQRGMEKLQDELQAKLSWDPRAKKGDRKKEVQKIEGRASRMPGKMGIVPIP